MDILVSILDEGFLNPLFHPLIKEYVLIAIAVACGLIVRLTLGVAGQEWAKTYSNTTTYLLLPLVGLVIVTVISNSIALSLGMIGALSIIRFRHPVKSPLELVVYFLLLTVGVALTTRPVLSIAMTIIASLIILGISWYQKFCASHGVTVFPPYPEVGDQNYLLEVTSSRPIDILANSTNLVFSNEERLTSLFSYKLGFTDREMLDHMIEQLRDDARIKEISGSYR
jgi:hypothetical protein